MLLTYRKQIIPNKPCPLHFAYFVSYVESLNRRKSLTWTTSLQLENHQIVFDNFVQLFSSLTPASDVCHAVAGRDSGLPSSRVSVVGLGSIGLAALIEVIIPCWLADLVYCQICRRRQVIIENNRWSVECRLPTMWPSCSKERVYSTYGLRAGLNNAFLRRNQFVVASAIFQSCCKSLKQKLIS